MRPVRCRPALQATLLVAVSLFAMLSAVPPVAAQAAPPAAVLVDKAGDVVLPSTGLGVPAGVLDSMDLVGLDVWDDELTLTFVVRIAELPGHQVPEVGPVNPQGRGHTSIEFSHGETEYRLLVGQNSEFSVYYYVQFYRWSDSLGGYSYVRGFRPQVDFAADTVSVTLQKSELIDQDGAAPFRSRSLDGLVARQVYSPTYAALGVVDSMPDDGNGVSYAIRGGVPQSGGLALWSNQPYRASNGEATTYLYTVQAENRGEGGVFLLETQGLPPGWQVEFPQPEVALDSGQTLPVPVLVTVPFAHEHGTRPSFLLRLTGDDPSREGQLRLGVSYVDPALASGHHPELFFHSQIAEGLDAVVFEQTYTPGRTYLWLNTKEGLNEVPETKVPGYTYQALGSTTATYAWHASAAMMGMGLDFDLASPIELTLPIESRLPLLGAQLTGDLFVAWRNTEDGAWDSITLANFASEPLDLAATETHVFELSALPMPDADRIEPRQGMTIGFDLYLTGERPAATTGDVAAMVPVLLPGARTRLPLLEYHDDVTDAFAAASGLRLEADGPSSRTVNPGETVLFSLAVRNDAAAGGVHIGLRGEHAEWARVVGSDRFDVATGGRETLRIAVTPPADAEDRQPLDLLVEAHGPDGATALLRLGGQVVTSPDVPDEAHLVPGVDEARDSPAPAVAWLALGVLALAVALRRSRLG